MEIKKRTKTHTRRVWKQKKMWYEKIMRTVTRNIDNLAELEQLKKQKR